MLGAVAFGIAVCKENLANNNKKLADMEFSIIKSLCKELIQQEYGPLSSFLSMGSPKLHQICSLGTLEQLPHRTYAD